MRIKYRKETSAALIEAADAAYHEAVPDNTGHYDRGQTRRDQVVAQARRDQVVAQARRDSEEAARGDRAA